jgi:ankyrin repeat protein
MPDQPASLLKRALQADDLPTIEALLRYHTDLLNAPRHPAVAAARSVATAERLLNLGADLDLVGKWWAPGFETRKVDTQVAAFLVERGVPLTPHAAAGLGLINHLADMLVADASIVDAKGGDGCTPLHFARNVEIAKLLLDRGARIDARDEDHESTPAQWLIGELPAVSRFLLDHGASSDTFLAAAFGDHALAEKLINANPVCRIGKLPEFPPIGYKGGGGTIYQWTLAFNSYSHQIALLKGHQDLFDFLYTRSDRPTRLLVSCVLAQRREAEAIVAQNPGLVASLPPQDHELVARYCWETNTNYDAVKLMLDIGFPIAHPERSHGYTPLHNAAWEGSGDLVELLIARGAPVDIVDPTYHSTPFGFAIYDCTVEKRHPEGEFARVVKALLDAGTPWDPLDYPIGDAAVDAVLEPRVRESIEGAAMLGDEVAMARMLGACPTSEQLAQALAGAAKGGHVDFCRSLIAAGAVVNAAQGPHELTALMYAVTSGSRETVALLLETGADVTARNAYGGSALHMAIANGASLEIVDLLLRSGARSLVETANQSGYTPMRIAVERGRDDVVKLLREIDNTEKDTP